MCAERKARFNLKASRKSRVFRRSAEIPQTQGVPTPEVVAIHVSNVVSIQRGSELDALKKLSTLVYDTKHAANEAAALGPQAATVSPSVLLHLLSTNHGSDVGSIEGALVYEACAVENFAGYSEDVRHDCVLDKAFCNLAAMMASRVTGSVSVEVVEATNDADFICAKALRMRDMLLELGVDVGARVLFKIPCTWQGVLAVERLEQQGVKCHVTQVYCLEQAAAAARAGAALVQVYVGRTRTWYQKHPIAAVHNNLGDAPDAGIELVKQVVSLIRDEGLSAKVIAASVKSKNDALALAGCEYILVNERVISTLNESLSASDGDELQDGFKHGSAPVVGEVTEKVFAAALRNSPGAEELAHALDVNAAADAKLKQFIANYSGSLV